MQKTSSIKEQASKDGMERLEVTVIPVDEEPYSKTITLPKDMMSKFWYDLILWRFSIHRDNLILIGSSQSIVISQPQEYFLGQGELMEAYLWLICCTWKVASI